MSETGLTVTGSMDLIALVCCSIAPCSLLVDVDGVLVGSHETVVGVVEEVLSPEHPLVLFPELSCSNMAKASISACSEVNVNGPKELVEPPRLWPWGSIDATENTLPPAEPVDKGESVCLFDAMGCSIACSSKLVYSCSDRGKSFLATADVTGTKTSFSTVEECLPSRASLSLLLASGSFTSAGRHEDGVGRVSSTCCNGTLGAVVLFLNSEFDVEVVTELWAAEHNEADDDNAVDTEGKVVG